MHKKRQNVEKSQNMSKIKLMFGNVSQDPHADLGSELKAADLLQTQRIPNTKRSHGGSQWQTTRNAPTEQQREQSSTRAEPLLGWLVNRKHAHVRKDGRTSDKVRTHSHFKQGAGITVQVIQRNPSIYHSEITRRLNPPHMSRDHENQQSDSQGCQKRP